MQETMQEMQLRFLGQEDPLEEGMATHFSFLVWRIPWTEKPGRLQSIGSQRVGHDWSNLACMHACTLWGPRPAGWASDCSPFPWQKNPRIILSFSAKLEVLFTCMVSNWQKEPWTGVSGININIYINIKTMPMSSKARGPKYLPILPGPGCTLGWQCCHWSYSLWASPPVLPPQEPCGPHVQKVSLTLPERLSHKPSWNLGHTRHCWEILLCSEVQILPGKEKIYQWSTTKKVQEAAVAGTQ